MLKKTCALLSVLIVLLALTLTKAKPVFYQYGNSFELYLNSASSLSSIVSASKAEYVFFNNVMGESVKVDKSNFELSELLSDFSATVKFVEQTNDCECVYAYSPKIKYKKTVAGQLVNLQIAVGSTQVTLGSPIIFGSF